MYPYNKRPRTTSSDTDEDEGDQYGYSDYTLVKQDSSESLCNEEDRDGDKGSRSSTSGSNSGSDSEDQRQDEQLGRAAVRKRKLALDDEEGVIKKEPPTYSDFSMKMMVFKPFIHFIDVVLFVHTCLLYTSILIHVSICYLFIYPFHRLVWVINLVWDLE